MPMPGGYAFVNFALFLGQPGSQRGGVSPSAITWKGFSNHWMRFYSAAFAVLHTAERTKRTELALLDIMEVLL